MKTLLIAMLMAVTFSANAFNSEEKNVNYAVLNAFAFDYTDAQNIVWSEMGNSYKASFTLAGEKRSAFYNYDGSFLGTSKVIALDKLPANVLRLFTTKYPFPPYQLKDCIEFTDADGEKNYYVSLDEAAKGKRIILKISEQGFLSVFKTEKLS